MDQRGLGKQELRPYIEAVRERRQRNPDNAVWEALGARLAALMAMAKQVVAESETGRPTSRYARLAAAEILKLDAADPDEVIDTVLALYILQDQDPRRFRSGQAFRTQMVRRVRSLGGTSVGTRVDKAGRLRRVYAELSPRAVSIMADWLIKALGAAGVRLAQLERRDQEGKVRRRDDYHKSLMELA